MFSDLPEYSKTNKLITLGRILCFKVVTLIFVFYIDLLVIILRMPFATVIYVFTGSGYLATLTLDFLFLCRKKSAIYLITKIGDIILSLTISIILIFLMIDDPVGELKPYILFVISLGFLLEYMVQLREVLMLRTEYKADSSYV
jgi:hypothetical protein